MVLGIVGIVFTLTICGAFAGAMLAVVGVTLGGVALAQYKTAEDQDGRGMATAGVVLSIVTLSIGVILTLLFWCGAFASAW